MYNSDQSQLILECFVPVEYTFSPHSIFNIQMNPLAPAPMPSGQNVNITFDYKTDFPGGVRIFARPYTGGSATPGYGASGSPLYPVGTGNGSGAFNIGAGDVIVDHIGFRMTSGDQSTQLLEFFVPVNYHYAANSVSKLLCNPMSPAALLHNQDVNLSFHYATDQAGGVRIFARPITNGNLTPGYAASGSPLYPVGVGSGTGSFTITGGDVVVDHIRIQMKNADQSQVLYEELFPVHYNFSSHAITNIVFAPGPDAFLTFNQHVNLTFDYVTTEPTGVRIFARPFSSGSLAPSYAAHGSPAYPTGTGNGSGYFTIQSSDVFVDQVRFQMKNDNQSQLLLELLVPTAFVFGHLGPTNVTEPVDLRPENYVLEQNYPNPFNPTTTIAYALPKASQVRLVIYDLLGRQIKTLVNAQQQAGHFQSIWDSTDEHNRLVAASVYFCRIEAGEFVKTIKLMLVK